VVRPAAVSSSASIGKPFHRDHCVGRFKPTFALNAANDSSMASGFMVIDPG
jgi:hypothetical protein